MGLKDEEAVDRRRDAVGAAFLVRRCASSCGGLEFKRLSERMPDNAPPKWMFRNVAVT